MLSLSPAKLLVILVIALIVLGPEKLPQVARQLGALWHDLRLWRGRLESEVRGTFPNMPPTHEVAQAVRSPLAFLDRLADEHERDLARGPAGTEVPPADPTAGSNGSAAGGGVVGSNGTAGADGTTHLTTGNGDGAGAESLSGPQAAPAQDGGTVAPGVSRAVPDDPSMN